MSAETRAETESCSVPVRFLWGLGQALTASLNFLPALNIGAHACATFLALGYRLFMAAGVSWMRYSAAALGGCHGKPSFRPG